MILYNVKDKYSSIIRKDKHIFLYKLIENVVEKKEINGVIEDIVIGYTYEYVIIDRTEDTEIKNGIDPVVNDFEKYVSIGREAENMKLKKSKIQEAREKRWNTVDNKVFDNNVFSNLSSERNANLLFQSIFRYKSGKSVNWVNLNGDSVKVDENNFSKLESLYSDISDFTQDTFDTLIRVINEINSIEIANDIMNFDIETSWNKNYESAF